MITFSNFLRHETDNIQTIHCNHTHPSYHDSVGLSTFIVFFFIRFLLYIGINATRLMVDRGNQTDPVMIPCIAPGTELRTSTPKKQTVSAPLTISPIKPPSPPSPQPETSSTVDPDYHPSELSFEEANEYEMDDSCTMDSEQRYVLS